MAMEVIKMKLRKSALNPEIATLIVDTIQELRQLDDMKKMKVAQNDTTAM